jgi:hypothetical protein
MPELPGNHPVLDLPDQHFKILILFGAINRVLPGLYIVLNAKQNVLTGPERDIIPVKTHDIG